MPAPDWLLEEVERLVREHGHVSRETNGQESANEVANPGQTGQYDAFGHQTDGRETKMYRIWLWRCSGQTGTGSARSSPPSVSVAQKAQHEKYEVYERIRCRRRSSLHQAGVTLKAEMLDAEGRGWAKAGGSKWQYAMAQWDAKVAKKRVKAR